MCFLWVWDPALRDEVADGHEGVETLRNGPWQAFSFRFILHITCSHVDSENITCISDVSSIGTPYNVTLGFMYSVRSTFYSIHSTLGILRMQIPYCLAHDETELNFIVHIHTTRS